MGGTWSCRGRDSQINAGSILDRVISQASGQDQCLLYRLANYKKGGELLDAYSKGGQQEVENVIREQFGKYLYENGKGQVINRGEYLRWRFRDMEQLVLPIEASLSRFDPLSKWTDHEACWQMQFRGSLGESLLHVLIICDTRSHTRIARTLLKCFPRLAIDIVEGEEYLGASALHLAIAYSNNELVQDLVEAGAIISQRATGSFFQPKDQQRPRPAKNTDYEGLAYLGEYPLAWAACCANESVYNLLLDNGADPDIQDTYGNMILHMVVVCDKLDMFGYALRHPKLPARNGIVNSAGLTPLTLACQLGRAEVFREMLELSAREFWRYSNITCSAYPLNALDTLLPDGRTNWNSALFIILNGTKEEHLDMLDGGIIQRLLEEKWKTFARFLKRLVILVFHLTSLSLAVYLRPVEIDEELMKWPVEIRDVGRTIAECITVLGVLSYILIQLGGEIVNIGVLSFLKQLSHEPAKFIFVISNLLILCCIPCRLFGNRHFEDAILVVAVPGSWFLLMFFAGAIRLTGPFVTMVYSMITGDMLTFGIIYMVVLFGFSQSFYFLYKGFPGVKSTLYHSYHSTWMALFQITLGDYSYSDLSNTTYPNLSKTVFAIFMVLVPILLLNMLIAMMGNTYAHVIEQSEKEWVKQWAKIVVSLERAVSQKDAHHYLQEYSIKLGPGDDPNNPASEQRGVMVIKSKSKTRARQRKGAVANWKMVCKVTINELRKRGMTGEDLRCIMWGRESFSTPVRTSPTGNERGITSTSGGFGDALTAALDVMAFTNDLDFSTKIDSVPKNVDQKLESINDQSEKPDDQSRAIPNAPTGSLSGVEEKVAKQQGQVYVSTTTGDSALERKTPGTCPRSTEPTAAFDMITEADNSAKLNYADGRSDPLLDLMIATESSTCNQETLLELATSARLESEASLKSTINLAVSERSAITNIDGTAMTTSGVSKDQFFNESDCDTYDYDGVSGSDARHRRIKFANRCAASTMRFFEKDSFSSSPSIDDNSGYRPLSNEPEIDASVVENPKASQMSKPGERRNEMDNKKSTGKPRRRRPRMAKNRISPKGSGEALTKVESIERGKTTSPPTSPSDPLEPWSTRDIKDMNSILAWQECMPDSP